MSEIISIQRTNNAEIIAKMAFQMELELWDGDSGGRTERDYITACRTLLQSGSMYWAFLATDSIGKPVGMITINQCAAIYAGGAFGEVMEFYVLPEYRSQGVGEQLILR